MWRFVAEYLFNKVKQNRTTHQSFVIDKGTSLGKYSAIVDNPSFVQLPFDEGGGYAKHTRTYCSSHLIWSEKLTDSVKSELRELIISSVKLEKVYKAAYGEIDLHQSQKAKELNRVSRRLAEISNEFQSLFQL